MGKNPSRKPVLSASQITLPPTPQVRLPATMPRFASSLLTVLAMTASASAAERPLSFVGDVLPRLAKAGCAAGTCHAKPEGQNNFKLSVLAYDPQHDYDEIVKDGRGRRVFEEVERRQR